MKEPFSFELPSDPENIALLETLLPDLKAEHGIGVEVYSDILICLTEAVNNAIHHGHSANMDKRVQIMYLHNEVDNKLIFEIRDEGKGFDPEVVPDPTKQENMSKEGGRGIYLMKALSEEICYYDNGRTLEMHFKIA